MWRAFSGVSDKQLTEVCRNWRHRTSSAIIPVNEWRAGDEKKEIAVVALTDLILGYVEQETAGSPTDETIKWTHLRPRDIALYLQQTHHIEVSNGVSKRI